MKFRRHNAPPEDTGIDLAPMLDFVMNLLIFFIIAAAFVQESGIRVNKPAAKTAKQEDKTSIFVAISKDNEIWIDRQHVDIRRLRSEIERMRRDKPKAAVVIQADQDARAGLMVEAMDQARLAGVPDVAIAATPKK
jgi:biopolymer transport protein ExbD